MMAHKHQLHELLEEDQEPFFLKSYIADRRSQLNRPKPKTTTLQPIKRSRPILYKQACFLSFHDSPDVRKSPFPLSPVPAKSSPCKTHNGTVRLHIPSRTAALLLEAAMRIQKNSSRNSKPKTQIKKSGLFGSILKRLGSKNRNCEIGGDSLASKSDGKCEKVKENVDEKGGVEMGFSCSCNNSRRNSGVWSESNEGKSLDLETSSSCSRSVDDEDSEEIDFESLERENGGYDFCEKHFCSSPFSPFRFALQNSPSPARRTPVFSSPATSPSRHNKQEKENYEAESVQKAHLEEEEEEKEQFSPVSVLDPPFEDDDDGNEDGDSYNLECSYANVQRTTQQLLHKLRRFEKLAELDPIELEKRMLEEQDNESENEDLEEEEECEEDIYQLPSPRREKSVNGFVREVLSKSALHLGKVSSDMKRLVLDLIAEEEIETDGNEDSEVAVKRVCERLDSWKEVQSNTIDMMVDLDFRREIDGWKRNDKEQVRETAMEIELAIFGLLVEEVSEELVFSPGV